jgi:hypothetical protein
MAETHLDRHLAAIALASEHKINIAKYATSEDLATIRGAFSQRPNSAPAPSSSPIIKRIVRPAEPVSLDLSFISSKELCEILERDISELNVARDQGLGRTSKTCMVLCGSIAEALLLDCLLRDKAAAVAVGSSLPQRLSSNPEDWDLYDMVTVATRLTPPLLPDDAITGATQLRRWRNLIHPGRELKDARNKRITPTATRAQNAISFLRLIAEELVP